jgi:trehalose-6-phosphate synthase
MATSTATRIAEYMASSLYDARLILVSNREPYVHYWHRQTPGDPGAAPPRVTSHNRWDAVWSRFPSQISRLFQNNTAIRWNRPAGGLTSALDPVMQACHGVWVAWGSGSADRAVVDTQGHVPVPPHHPQYTLRRLWLSEAQVRGFYNGFANSMLWPLCHLYLERTVFKPLHWRHYQEVNTRFAEVAAEECGGANGVVWVQDYHLALCPAVLRRLRPALTILHFWHIPWPPWEVYRACPWRRELLEGLLGNDLLGFHLAQHCRNFLECAERVLGASVDTKAGVVAYAGRETWVRPFPISIDYEWWASLARQRQVARRIARLRTHPDLAFPILGLGVDRLDYTKGIVRRFEAIERLLEKYPEHRGRFGFVQIAPIHYRYEHLEPSELVAYYRMADFAMVTSLYDGMNLVAKEFVASQVERQGVLICSEFAGAAEELDNALLINPYDIESVAHSLHQAITMPAEEKARRMERLQKHIAEHNIYKWLADIFMTLEQLQREQHGTALALVAPSPHHPPAHRSP